MTSKHGTRSSAALAQESTLPISIQNTPPLSSPQLAHSSVKARKLTPSGSSRRRLSTSSTSLRKGLDLSLPVPTSFAMIRGKPTGNALVDDDDDGMSEIKGGSLSKREKGAFYECEKCSKVYRHSTCLVKHRWEHTTHWNQTSSLLLSKHQQVALLEASSILFGGGSLPEEKSYWPAAVSPPSSGLLGSHSLNIHVLSSPRLGSMRPLPPLQDVDTPPPADLDEDEEESTTTSDDMLTEDNMFDMELEGDESVGEGSSPAAVPTSKMMGSGLSMGLGALGLNSPLVRSVPLGSSLESRAGGVRSQERTQL